MTKILDKAIAKIRTLPPEDQDILGAVIFALADEELARLGELDEQTRDAIREGLAQVKRGEIVPDEEVEALWRRFAL